MNGSNWLGVLVEQVSCDPGNERFLNRRGTVDLVITDENGQIHARTKEDETWCPARLLQPVES